MRGSNNRGRGGDSRGGRGGFSGRRPQETALLRSNILANQTNAVRRLQKDLKELRDAEVPLVGVSASPLDDSIYTWHANIRGPEGTLYHGGVFHMEIVFPKNYPCSPPTISLFSDIPHPNVFGRTLCLDMLQEHKKGEWYEGWTSAYTVEAILIQLQSFLFEVPSKKKVASRRGPG
jgi:ubiquitin-protein ligase